MAKLNVPKLLKEDFGMDIVGFDQATGLIEVQRQDGSRGKFNPKVFVEEQRTALAERGLKPEDIEINVNAPETAFNQTPVTGEQRFKLSFGNTKGSINFLKKSFEDAAQTEDGLVVKKNGAWFKVDPSLLGSGDAWEKTKELGRDIVDFVSTALDIGIVSATSAAGRAVGGGIGAGIGLATSGLGGAATGATVGGAIGQVGGAVAGTIGSVKARTVLGKGFGTFDATEEELAGQTMMETGIAFAAEVVPAGVRPLKNQFVKGFKFIKNKAHPAVKETFTELYGSLTGFGKKATEISIERPGKVFSALGGAERKAIKAGGGKATTDDVAFQAAKSNLTNINRAIDVSDRSFKIQSAKATNEVLKKATGFQGSIKTTITDIEQKLVDRGYGKIDAGQFKFFDPIETLVETSKVIEKAGSLGPGVIRPRFLTTEQKRALQPTLNLLQEFKKVQTSSGRAGAAQMMEFSKQLTQNLDTNFSKQTLALDALEFMKELRSISKSTINNTFTNNNLGKEFADLNAFTNRFSKSIANAKEMKNRGTQQKLIDGFFASGAEAIEQKQTLADLKELAGSRGASIFERIENLEAAKRIVSTSAETNSLIAVARRAGRAAVSPRLALGVASAAESTAKNTRMLMEKTLDFIKSLPGSEKARLLQDPIAFNALVREIGKAHVDIEQGSQQLIQGALQATQGIPAIRPPQGGQNGQ